MSAVKAHPEGYDDLVETIARRGAVLFVGAGSSCRAGYPTWSALLAELEAEARAMDAQAVDDVRDADGLLRASTYRRVLGTSAFRAVLERSLAPRTPPHLPDHETLVAIPFRSVLTTNYDGVLQSAHVAGTGAPADTFDVDEREKLAALEHEVLSSTRRTYVHLHGSVRRPDGIVLCKEDYDARYLDAVFLHFIRTWITIHRFVFVGFSLTDEDFQFVLREAERLAQSSTARHFAILPRPANENDARIQAINIRGKYGIQVVYYDNSTGDYSGLWNLIRHLRADVEAKAQPIPIAADVVGAALDRVLASHPDLREAAHRELPELTGRSRGPMLLGNTTGGSTPIDLEIDDLFRLVTGGRPDDAISQYEAMEAQRGASLTPRQRYRVQGNIGSAYATKGDHANASRHFLIAASHFRESPGARGLEVLGHTLAGDRVTANRLADELRIAHPDFARGWALWVRTLATGVSFAEIEAAVPEQLRADAEVALALADLAARAGHSDEHVSYARLAVTASPDWVDALAVLGAALGAIERDRARFDADHGLVVSDPARLREAHSVLTRAVTLLHERDPAGLSAGLLLNRSVVNRLLGDERASAEDLLAAFLRDPDEPAIALAFAMEAESAHEIADALTALTRVGADLEYGHRVSFTEALLRYRRRDDGDLDVALQILRRLTADLGAVTPAPLRIDVVRLTLHVLVALDRPREGPEVIDRLSPTSISESQRAGLRSRALLASDQREQAVLAAKEAIEHLGNTGSHTERRDLAMLAQECGLHAESLTLWRSLVAPDDTSSDTARLAVAAYHSRDWRTALDVCAAVRTAGKTTSHHLAVEIEILAQTNQSDRAIALLQDWMTRHPHDRRATLFFSVLTLMAGRPDLAVFDPSLLPAVPDIASSSDGAKLVFVLRRGPAPETALAAAYELYRRFPDEHDAHWALISCVFDPSAAPIQIDRPSVVCNTAAVLVCRDGEPDRWVYVEPGPNPAISRGEHPPSHDFVRAMVGLGADARFEYSGHTYLIRHVEGRILRRCHELMERYEENFPDHGLLKRFNVPTDVPADAPLHVRLGDVYPALQEQDRNRQLLESMYREHSLPITSFAKLHGRPLFNVVRGLANDPSMGIRAAVGDPERWDSALRDCAAKTLVLDATVLAGAMILGLLDDLPAIGKTLLVPRSVLEQIRRLSLEAASQGASHGTMGLHNGRFFFREWSAEDVAHEVGLLESVVRFVDNHCEVVDGGPTLDLPSELRKSLEQLIDGTSLDAIALAHHRQSPLWTDDLGLQQLIADLLPAVRTVWTQAVAKAALDVGAFSEQRLTRLHAAMLVHGYAFTRLSADEFTSVLQASQWRVDSLAGEALARVAASVALLNPRNLLIVGLALKKVITQCPQRSHAVSFIERVLFHLGLERAPMFARRIYRYPRMRRMIRVPDAAGGVAPVVFDYFGDPAGRQLKRLLRSWRSRDGEFRPRES